MALCGVDDGGVALCGVDGGGEAMCGMDDGGEGYNIYKGLRAWRWNAWGVSSWWVGSC